MARARTIKPIFMPAHPLSLARRLHPGGELREAFGSECEKPRDDKALASAAEIPEPFASSRVAREKIRKAPMRRAFRPISRAIHEAKDFFDARQPWLDVLWHASARPRYGRV
jgi:hypothetical protein